jgi:hypothetical protein
LVSPSSGNNVLIDATASRMNLEESKVDEYRKVWKYYLCNTLVLYDFEHLFKKEIQLFCFWRRFHWGSVYLNGRTTKIIVN